MKYKINDFNYYYNKCFNLFINIELRILIKFYNKYIILKINNNLLMNLIYKKEYYQDKVDLDKYINVKIIQIFNFMQLK